MNQLEGRRSIIVAGVRGDRGGYVMLVRGEYAGKIHPIRRHWDKSGTRRLVQRRQNALPHSEISTRIPVQPDRVTKREVSGKGFRQEETNAGGH
jgi:hypothetical protein